MKDSQNKLITELLESAQILVKYVTNRKGKTYPFAPAMQRVKAAIASLTKAEPQTKPEHWHITLHGIPLCQWRADQNKGICCGHSSFNCAVSEASKLGGIAKAVEGMCPHEEKVRERYTGYQHNHEDDL